MNCPEKSNAEPSICVGCGFCCDGTLHGHTDVAPHDEATAAAAGLSLVNQGGKTIFHQPCPRFSGGICTIYERRPAVCRGYRCKLRKDLDEGRVGIAEAREKIEAVKTLVASINSLGVRADTPARRLNLWRQLKDSLDQYEGEERARRATVILNLGALEYYLDRWFRRKKTVKAGETMP
jgi:Fe-S-cluster containining protein